MSNQLSVAIQSKETPAAPAPDSKETQELILGKFTSDEEVRKAYVELQKEYSKLKGGDKPSDSKPEEDGSITPDPNNKPEAPKTPDLSKFDKEFSEKGTLSDESFNELQSKYGIDRKTVEQYIAGQQALQQVTAQNSENVIRDTVGSKEDYQKLVDWASKNLDAEDIKAFNDAVGGTVASARLAINALKQRHAQQYGTNPKLIGGGRSAYSGIVPFASWDQVTQAMDDPRYRSDPAYVQEVTDRMAVSSL